jgi:outer membrane receptor for ferrienterochelin and colicins
MFEFLPNICETPPSELPSLSTKRFTTSVEREEGTRMNFRVLFVAIAFLLTVNAVAQSAAPAAAAGSRSYLPADFAQFAPRNALDMLSRVPGFGIKEEDDERGLGEATGNVLINGQRISGKSNDVVTELSRIPAANVERIDIVDGATLDVPGLSGQVANMIVRSTGISGQWAYRPEFRSYYTDPLFTRFEVSVSGTKGPVQYTIGLDNQGNRSGAGGPTWIFSPSGSLMEERDEEWRGNADRPRLSGRFVFDGPGTAKGNLNLLYGRLYYDYLETGTRTSVGGANREREVTVDEHGHNYEIGGDYEFELGMGRLKLIAVGRGSRYPNETTVVTRFPDSTAIGNRFTQIGDEQELIGRTEYRWTGGGAEWQLSAEGAFNSLDNTSRLFELQSDGGFDEIPLPGGTASVEEKRYEVMGSYGRPLAANVTMKLSAGGEYSQLAQAGAGGTTRMFYRPKGELSTAWKVSPRTDVNVKLARRVGQLNFFDFLASVNLQDEVENAANPDLVPEQSWDFEVETVRNLGTLGSTTVRLYGRLIDDIIDYIPIGTSGESPGNLESATVYGIEWRGTFTLDSIGWKGARLDAEAQMQESEVEDPLTGEQRSISNSLLRYGSLAIRYDVPNTSWAFGTAASYQINALNYRLTEVGRFWEGPVWGNFYVEHKNVGGLTVRAGLYNFFAADSMWDRTVHDGRRTDPVDFVEHRDRQIGPIFSFQVRGKF